jgi:hypothetical protein
MYIVAFALMAAVGVFGVLGWFTLDPKVLWFALVGVGIMGMLVLWREFRYMRFVRMQVAKSQNLALGDGTLAFLLDLDLENLGPLSMMEWRRGEDYYTKVPAYPPKEFLYQYAAYVHGREEKMKASVEMDKRTRRDFPDNDEIVRNSEEGESLGREENDRLHQVQLRITQALAAFRHSERKHS